MAIKNKDYLFETKSENFKQAQANMLLTDISENEFMPLDSSYSGNKSLNTTTKNVISAINEVFSLAHDAYEANKANQTVKTINSIGPDSSGNIKISHVKQADCDALGQKIDSTYATQAYVNEKLASDNVKSINGITPDDQGNIALESYVKSVNGIHPAVNGNITLDLSGYVTTHDVRNKVEEILDTESLHLYKVTVNGVAPDATGNINVAHADKSDEATIAQSAGKATSADYARTAGAAHSAQYDVQGNEIVNYYVAKSDLNAYATKADLKDAKDGFGTAVADTNTLKEQLNATNTSLDNAIKEIEALKGKVTDLEAEVEKLKGTSDSSSSSSSSSGTSTTSTTSSSSTDSTTTTNTTTTTTSEEGTK